MMGSSYLLPPSLLSRKGSVASMNDEELDSYFASYAPLSNLPTPPLSEVSSDDVSLAPSTSGFFTPSTSPTPYDLLDDLPPTLHLPAIHLANLVPNTSIHRPHPPTLHRLLARSDLPLPTVALTAAILDALSSHFARAYRTAFTDIATPLQQLPLRRPLSPTATAKDAPPAPVTVSACSTSPPGACWTQPTDVPRPELVVIAAMKLAAQFASDAPPSAELWARWSEGRADARQINRCGGLILRDVEYGLLGLTEGATRWMTLWQAK